MTINGYLIFAKSFQSPSELHLRDEYDRITSLEDGRVMKTGNVIRGMWLSNALINGADERTLHLFHDVCIDFDCLDISMTQILLDRSEIRSRLK